MRQQLLTDDIILFTLLKNNELIGWIDVEDEIRPEAKDVINYLHSKNIKTILLSGDTHGKNAKKLQMHWALMK